MMMNIIQSFVKSIRTTNGGSVDSRSAPACR